MSDLRARPRRSLGLLALLVAVLAVAWIALGRASPSAAPLPSGEPANGVTFSNGIASAT